MYTRILTRGFGAALAVTGILPGIASASLALSGQQLLAPDSSNSVIGASSAVVSGDWIAVFGRSTDLQGGGQVMLYQRGKGGVWSYAQTLAPPDADACIDTMVMSGDMLFVACPRALDTDRAANMGVVAVYTLADGQWQWSQTITSATGFFSNPGFGSSLAVSGTQLFVGYTGYASMAGSLVFGDVEVFDISAIPASYQMQVLPDASVAYSNFGSSLATSAGLLAVGANNQDIGGTGQDAGVIYTFEQADGAWFERSVLTSADPHPYDNFPSALIFNQSQLIAGSATNGALEADGSLGAAFTYGGHGGNLALNDVLMPNEAQTDTLFGQSLAVVGNTIFVGEPSGGVGGHVHIYSNTPSGWTHSSSFEVAATQPGDQFGHALASDGNTLVVTALGSPPSGAGSVFVFDAPPTDQIFGDGVEP
jgi:hypothetical protein